MPSSPTLLAIESSCDETSAAVLQGGVLLSNVVATQEIHQQYGGVVPELASRAHQQHIVPVVHEALQRAKVPKNALDAIAFTQGPGLLGALLVGASFAKSMAQGLQIPVVAVHHMRAHILAHFLETPHPPFPFLCLTVSGGHTQLVQVNSPLDMHILGETLDDAVGEAFDKAAKMLGLPYPGGPLIDRHAQTGNPQAFAFTITEMPELNYSFSGVKTNILYFLQAQRRHDPDFVEHHLADLCASIQYTLVETLLVKLRKAAAQTGIRHITIAGGVSANSGLRQALTAEARQHDWHVYIPKMEYCTDNAAMIAMAAHFQYQAGQVGDLAVSPQPRLPF
ncbi:N6-L-threonylcarbamoyladenine synthase [Catalinimonas alkaloidigena]|uniref:tRNA N6-adenosine threonylcarbamoyltransferase n=1 Tax=Catalinimonas alkaloidigena TaxID=1075417 RepID=A0A1G9QMK8_9BACT|nr:tRNA (adenosine(37)-N6)-threonylcarbamoyltransferase complex transferase subunit TsaD [Catalinimonas alkaloidigena]SDM12051.1 N6-L-threonylcarbamoyladenine synthase [Catalinimonas alkaloidigena]